MSEEGEPIGIIELDQNLADVEKPPILPPGRYTGEVQDVQTPTSQAGNRYFAIKIVVPPEQIRADMADQFEDGAVLYWNRQIVPDGKDRRALYNLRKLLEAMGMDTKTVTVDPNEWMGKQIGIQVRQSTYQGETRAEIGSVHPVGNAAPAQAATAKPATAKATAARGRR